MELGYEIEPSLVNLSMQFVQISNFVENKRSIIVHEEFVLAYLKLDSIKCKLVCNYNNVKLETNFTNENFSKH